MKNQLIRLVHPDLFSQSLTKKVHNERSLQSLNALFSVINSTKKPTYPISSQKISFYLRDDKSKQISVDIDGYNGVKDYGKWKENVMENINKMYEQAGLERLFKNNEKEKQESEQPKPTTTVDLKLEFQKELKKSEERKEVKPKNKLNVRMEMISESKKIFYETFLNKDQRAEFLVRLAENFEEAAYKKWMKRPIIVSNTYGYKKRFVIVPYNFESGEKLRRHIFHLKD